MWIYNCDAVSFAMHTNNWRSSASLTFQRSDVITIIVCTISCCTLSSLSLSLSSSTCRRRVGKRVKVMTVLWRFWRTDHTMMDLRDVGSTRTKSFTLVGVVSLSLLFPTLGCCAVHFIFLTHWVDSYPPSPPLSPFTRETSS